MNRTSIIRAGLWTALFSIVGAGLKAQEESCLPPEDRKAAKLAETTTDTTKHPDERLQAAIALTKESSDNLWSLYQKTELQYWRNWSMQKPVEVLEDEFEEIVAGCPESFPLAYYYLGNIAYLNGNPSGATAQYKQFLKVAQGAAEEVPYIRLQEARESIQVLAFRDKLESEAKDIQPVTVQGINTRDQEYLPAISPDNTTIYLTRKFSVQDRGSFGRKEVEKIMEAKRVPKTNDFKGATAMERPFNYGPGNYGGMSVNLTGKEIYLTVCVRDQEGYANCDIVRAEKKVNAIEGEEVYYYWADFDSIPSINTPKTWESQPSIASDGRSLLFAKYSDYTNGIDIYQSTRDSAGKWSKPQPLGGRVNSAGNDKAPFLHPDGTTLYFSSDGHQGLGGYDIFVSRKENGVWQEPVNLGLPINTEEDEHGLIVSTDGKYGYYATNKFSESGDFDIITFPMPEPVKPDEILVYKGFVDNPGEGAKLDLTRADGKTIKSVDVSSGDGMYATILRKDDLKEPLVATVKKKGYAFSSELVNEEQQESGVIKGEKLALKEITPNEPYRINDINFATNSAELRKSTEMILKRFKEFLDLNPTYRVEIHGHTDNVGGAAENKALSLQRALSVKEYLVGLGIPESRLSHKGFGQEQPLEDNSTEAGRAKNRRTEFVLVE